MRINASITGDLRAMLEEDITLVADALRSAMGLAAERVQADLRGQTASAGLGQGLQNAWRTQVYPTGRRTLRPAGLVYSKSTVLHRVFAEGAVIWAARRRYLAIPTKEAEALGYAVSSRSRKGGPIPGDQQRRASQVEALVSKLGEKNVTTLPARGGKKLIVYTPPSGRRRGRTVRGRGGVSLGFQNGKPVPLFILVPQVSLRARIDFAGAETRAQGALETAIAGAMQAS